MSTKTKLSLKTITATKKIESPLAKYNSTGQLFCVLCNVHVKNEMYWTGHINGKAHRDQVILVKNKGKPQPASSSIPQKRSIAPVSSASSIPQKRSIAPVSSASSIPQKRSAAPVSSASSIPQKRSIAPVTSASSSIASSSSSVSSDDGNGISSTTTGNFGNGETYLAPLHKRLKLEDLVVSPMGPPPSILKKTSYQPPRKKTFKEIEDEEAQMDVDSSIGSSSRIKFRNLSSPTIADDDDDDDDDNEEGETEESSSGGTPTDALPAGFFDDAKQDAKARGLEYKNPDEAEWDKFVKEIASEDVKSSALRTADEEDSAKDRELDEIEEQMKNWQRVVELERKAKEAQRKLQQDKESKSEKMSTSDDEDIDEDYDDDLDWRTKKKN